jgi:hypothetical protein
VASLGPLGPQQLWEEEKNFWTPLLVMNWFSNSSKVFLKAEFGWKHRKMKDLS